MILILLGCWLVCIWLFPVLLLLFGFVCWYFGFDCFGVLDLLFWFMSTCVVVRFGVIGLLFGFISFVI